MLTYGIPMVPGPTRVPESVRRAYLTDFASADLEPDYSGLYAAVQDQLRTVLGTRNRIAVMTGEGLIALWSGLNSCLRPGDRVLALSTGVYSYGIGEMAASIGAEVRWVEFGYDEIIQPDRVEETLGWELLNRRLRERGMGVGGSLGPLAGKVFRLGHMGTQADPALVDQAMDTLAEAITGV